MNPSAGNSSCPNSSVHRPNEHTTYMLFGYSMLNKQPLLARLKPAGGTKLIVVIGESTYYEKYFDSDRLNHSISSHDDVNVFQYLVTLHLNSAKTM